MKVNHFEFLKEPLVHVCIIAFYRLSNIEVVPVIEWWRPLIFSALNHSSSLRCGIEPSSGHVGQTKLSGGFSQGSPVFAQPNDWVGSKYVK